MGYQDRDYRKESLEPPNYIKLPNLAPIFWLIISCFILSLIEYDKNLRILTDISFSSIFRNGHVWSIFIAPFAPDFFWTALWHCLILYYVGRRFIQTDGLAEFLSLYFLSAFVGMSFFWGVQALSSNFEFFVSNNIDAATWSLGGICMVYAVRYPTERVLLYFILPIQIKLLMLGVLIIILLKMANNGSSFAEYFSFLSALGFGFLVAYFQFRLLTLSSRLKRIIGKIGLLSSGGGLSIKTMTEEEIKNEIDRLLDKITEKGPGALSAKERDFLMKSSKRNK